MASSQSPIDPSSVLGGLFLNIAANIITWVVSSTIAWGRDHTRQPNSLQASIEAQVPLMSTLASASNRFRSAFTSTSLNQEAFRIFLTSPEVASLLKSLFAGKVTGHPTPFEQIRAAYVVAFFRAMQLPTDASQFEDIAGQSFDILLLHCETALDAAVDRGSLGAHDAKSQARFVILKDKLDHIEHQLQFFRKTAPSVQLLSRFATLYRAQAAKRFGVVPLPSVDSQKRIPLEHIYVKPTLTSLSQPKLANISLDDLRTSLLRSVVLGNPGAGKSTLATSICHDLTHTLSHSKESPDQRLPFIVVLRDYSTWRIIHGNSILNFIATQCTLQVVTDSQTLEYMLEMGYVTIVFDGLDELLDSAARRTIRDEVESFGHRYPETNILITSREVGYDQAPLDPNQYELFKIADFSDAQVQEYSSKWFRNAYPDESSRASDLAKSFVLDTKIVSDLRSNALMLSLMCSLYNEERYIPKNRPEIYEKCATLLFEKWDSIRSIRVSLPFEAHVGPAMKFLAYWIYVNPDLQKGVTETQIVNQTVSYLYPKLYDDVEDAKHDAVRFVAHCRGRAWVFTDTGSTSESDRLYQFTHRTFLEYFAAAHLVRINPVPERLLRELIPKIKNQEWDVVSQLAIQVQSKNVAGAADECLGSMLDEMQRATDWRHRSHLLSFCARSLEFLVPSQSTVRRVTLLCLNDSLDYATARRSYDSSKEPSQAEPDRLTTAPLASICLCRSDNQSAALKAIYTRLTETIRSSHQETSEVAIEVGMNISVLLDHSLRSGENAAKQFAEKVRTWVIGDCGLQIQKAALSNLRIAMDAKREGVINIRSFIDSHGGAALFSSVGYACQTNIRSWAYSLWMIVSVLYGKPTSMPKSWRERIYEDLKILGGLLQVRTPPWITLDRCDMGDLFSHFIEHEKDRNADKHASEVVLLPSQSHSVILVLCVAFEAYMARSQGRGLTHRVDKAIGWKSLMGIEKLFCSRELAIEHGDYRGVDPSLIASWGLTGIVAGLIERWSKGEVSFVSHGYQET